MNLHKVSCVFFGFYVDRGEFDIYGTTILKIEMLNWKYYSELLAVWVRYEEWFSIQIRGFSNFHSYLKQKWRYFTKNKLIFAWDSERRIYGIWYSWTPYGLVTWFTLHIWLSGVVYSLYDSYFECACYTTILISWIFSHIYLQPLSFKLFTSRGS